MEQGCQLQFSIFTCTSPLQVSSCTNVTNEQSIKYLSLCWFVCSNYLQINVVWGIYIIYQKSSFTWQSAACFSASEFGSIHLNVEKVFKIFFFYLIKQIILTLSIRRESTRYGTTKQNKKEFEEKINKNLLEIVKKFQKY